MITWADLDVHPLQRLLEFDAELVVSARRWNGSISEADVRREFAELMGAYKIFFSWEGGVYHTRAHNVTRTLTQRTADHVAYHSLSSFNRTAICWALTLDLMGHRGLENRR